MSNIRTANKRHKRAIVADIARDRASAMPATDTPSPGEPVKAAV